MTSAEPLMVPGFGALGVVPPKYVPANDNVAGERPDKEALSQAELKAELSYDPATGLFSRLTTRGNGRAGDVAGTDDGQGYIKIQVLGRRHKAHRLAWLYIHGQFPTDEIDHVNGIKSDNRLANLREASTLENCRNRPRRSDNKLGLKGVSFHKSTGKYRAKIYYGGKEHSLGLYSTPQEAHAAYVAAANDNFKQFARAE